MILALILNQFAIIATLKSKITFLWRFLIFRYVYKKDSCFMPSKTKSFAKKLKIFKAIITEDLQRLLLIKARNKLYRNKAYFDLINKQQNRSNSYH